MFSNETRKLKLYSRLALLDARDPMGNQHLIAKIKRRLRMMGERV